MLTLSCQPLCQKCSQEVAAQYVHLCSGTVVRIGNVRQIRLTDQEVIFDCGDGEAVLFARSEVYATSCEENLPPGF